MADGGHPYPGSDTDPADLLVLADQYGFAFRKLQETKMPEGKLVGAPARLLGVHAIELYLNVCLRLDKLRPEEVRRFGHNLAAKADHPSVQSLALRQKTRLHLARLTDTREYLLVRYAPDRKKEFSEMTRLTATLADLAKKVSVRLDAVRRT